MAADAPVAGAALIASMLRAAAAAALARLAQESPRPTFAAPASLAAVEGVLGLLPADERRAVVLWLIGSENRAIKCEGKVGPAGEVTR